MNVDLTTLAGMSALVLGVISAVKFAWPAWTEEKEPRLAIVLGLVVGVVARLARPGAFPAGVEGWVAAIVQGLTAAMTAGVAHDKLLNPIKKGPDVPKGNDDSPK